MAFLNLKDFLKFSKEKEIEKKRHTCGFRLLNGLITRVLQNTFNGMKVANSSGMLVHNEYLEQKIEKFKPEKAKKITQNLNNIILGTAKRNLLSAQSHFLTRIMDTAFCINTNMRAEKILKNFFEKKKFILKGQAMKQMNRQEGKVLQKKKKPPIDEENVPIFVDIIKQFFDERKAIGFASTKAFVIQYEVLNVEEVDNGQAGEYLLSAVSNMLPQNVLGTGGSKLDYSLGDDVSVYTKNMNLNSMNMLLKGASSSNNDNTDKSRSNHNDSIQGGYF